MKWRWAVWVISFAGVVSTTSAAGAQDPESFVLLDDGSFVCEAMRGCDASVPGVCADPEICGQVGSAADPGLRCHLGYDGFVCCDPEHDAGNAQCTLYDGEGGIVVEGACLAVEIDGDADVSGVCNYPLRAAAAPTFCVHADGDPSPWLEPCMTAPSPDPGNEGEPVENWRDGDCDEDGWTNGAEFDQDCSPCDGAEFLVDGVCVVSSMPDAGLDGGGPPDAGPDSGTAPDAARDTGGARPAGPEFRGTGGCACRASGARSMGEGVLAVVALFLLGVRSRRRMARRP